MASAPSPARSPTSDYSAYPAYPDQSVGGGSGDPPAYPGRDALTVESGGRHGQTSGGGGTGENGEPHRRLSTGSNASTESSINENLEVASVTSSIEDRLTWRGRMQMTLHSHTFHFIIIALVVLDAVIVLFELLLDLGAFSNIECEGEGVVEQAEFCHYSDRDKCGPPAVLLLENANISSAVGSPGLGADGLCSCDFSGGKRICLLGNEPGGVNPGIVLHSFSLLILSVFMIEIGLKLISFRLKYFLPSIHRIRGHKFYFITFEMFDGMVVVISWILDVASLKEEEAFELIDLVIILRLWRIVRVVNGAVLSAKAQLDQQLHEAKHQTRHVITALHKAQDKIDLLERDNQMFRQRLIQAGHKLPPPEIRVDTPSAADREHSREE